MIAVTHWFAICSVDSAARSRRCGKRIEGRIGTEWWRIRAVNVAGWHRDRPIYGHVLGLSLGEPATMRFRRRRTGGFERAAAPLKPRAAYHLGGPARHEWEHSIVALERPRWSITFRSLAAHP
ncbi:alpha-ketoglutarate-dependent dioxygenase AlkB [Sphingomonas sp. T9W2]|uniref:alpha-ketoglutarate-dependent dioxygenase AlkB n=1 Tax=Sphingomonas sp. T9W2 TaxID=3143183 RepID=UPI0031F4832C